MRRSGSSVEPRVLRGCPRARRTLYAAAALAISATGCWIAFVLLVAAVVDRVFIGQQALDEVEGLLLVMGALVLVRGALLWSNEIVLQRAANGVKTDLRERLAAKLVGLGPTYTRRERVGELVYAAGEGIESLDAYVTRYVPSRQLAASIPVLVAAVVFVLDPWTVPILLVAGPALVLLLTLIGRRIRVLTERRERELAWMNAQFLDVLRGLPTLKMFGRSIEQAETIERVSDRAGSTTMDVLRTAFQTTLVLEWGATAATALVAIETSVRLMAGDLAFGRALAVLLLAPEFFVPLRRLSGEYHVGRSGAAASERVQAILDEPVRIPESTGVAQRPPPMRFDLRLEDVVIAYDGRTRAALSDCSFEIPHGRTVALVGPTGAGKTTVANVLLRFVEPDRGRVTVDGTPLRAIDPIAWRRLVAWVPQHPSLFEGTVAENLRLARADATQEELVAAAIAANAHGFVEALPEGYATPIGEGGARLSGGERQRLALARACLKDAPLLILDEPTSHLDDESESLVLDAISRLVEGRTVLTIAHRPEPIAAADVVVTLRAGRVVMIDPSDRASGRTGGVAPAGLGSRT